MASNSKEGKKWHFFPLLALAVDKLHLLWLGPWSFNCDAVGVAICQTLPPPTARKLTWLANFKRNKRKQGPSLPNNS